MELLLIPGANSIAPPTLLAESLRHAIPHVSASVVVPVPCLIAVAIVLAAAIIMSVTARRSKRITERVVDSLGCGVFAANLDGVLTYANQALYQTLDCGSGDVIGKQMDEVFKSNLFCDVATFLEDIAIRRDPPRIVKIAKVHSGGRAKYLEVDFGVVWKTNKPTAFRGVVQDITENVRLEEELRALNALVIERARLCSILETRNELLEERHRQLREVSMRLDKKLAEVRRLHGIAKQMAITDSVTGLHNHRHFQERFAEELRKAEEDDKCLSVLMIDIDGFKDYNDAFGHMAGDDALRTVSNLLASSVRSTDIVARYGGEEFVILLSGAGKAPAFKLAESIRIRVEEHSFRHKTALHGNGLTVSIGVATYPVDGATERELLYAADMACYRGKREGKNRVVEA